MSITHEHASRHQPSQSAPSPREWRNDGEQSESVDVELQEIQREINSLSSSRAPSTLENVATLGIAKVDHDARMAELRARQEALTRRLHAATSARPADGMAMEADLRKKGEMASAKS